MDDRLINEYIKNLAAEVQSLKMENILLKTRLGILANPAQPEQAKQEEQQEEPQPKPQEDWDEQPEDPELKPAELGSARNEDGNFSN
jgi:regulator of replication initiation timing